MTLHQIHFERKFYKDTKTGYWISCSCPKIRAHRWVWIQIHGLIPNGYHIHHKDGDKSNNDINNLELMEKSRHMSLHMQGEDRKRQASENCNTIRPLTKAWHASEEGRTWHKLHALKNNFGNGPLIEYKCQYCGKDYQSKVKGEGSSRFCGNNCKSAWRRKEGLDNIQSNCILCGNEFIKNKYMKTKTCTESCAAKQRWKDRRGNT